MEGRVRPRHIQCVGQDLQSEVLSQCLIGYAHLLGVAKYDLGLIAGGRKRVNLSARLSIRQKAVQGHTGTQTAFAVAARHFDVDATKSTAAVRSTSPTEDGRQDPDLPRLELDLLPGQSAFGVSQQLDELANAVAFAFRKCVQAMIFVALAVFLIAADGLLDELTGKHLTAQDISLVLGRHFAEVFRSHQTRFLDRRLSSEHSHARASLA